MANTDVQNDRKLPSLAAQCLAKGWIHIDFITCTECLEHSSEHFNNMLTCLYQATRGKPEKDFIYNQLVKIINKTFHDEQQAKEIRRQVRKLLNERITETAQHVCQTKKNKSALRSIAEELSLLPELFLMNKENGTVLFDQLERFDDVCGQAELSEYGCRAIQSFEKHSPVMMRGRKLYTYDHEKKNTFEISLQIEQFHSTIYIGICSDNASPADMEQASNTFPVSSSYSVKEGNVFHLLIDVADYSIYLWNGYRPKKYQNTEQKKRQRTISKRRCPLPWRFFVVLSNKDNHVRIVY
jgi:hypothetical protein